MNQSNNTGQSQRIQSSPIKTQSKYMLPSQILGKYVQGSHEWHECFKPMMKGSNTTHLAKAVHIITFNNQVKTTLKYCLIAELSSGLKGRRADPHNHRGTIEIEKTTRLSFHGHRAWLVAWLAGT